MFLLLLLLYILIVIVVLIIIVIFMIACKCKHYLCLKKFVFLSRVPISCSFYYRCIYIYVHTHYWVLLSAHCSTCVYACACPFLMGPQHAPMWQKIEHDRYHFFFDWYLCLLCWCVLGFHLNLIKSPLKCMSAACANAQGNMHV